MNLLRAILSGSKATARHLGIEISRVRPIRDPIDHFAKKLDEFGIQTVFDVGANKGQFGKALFGRGFNKSVVSFEPLRDQYEILLRAARNNPNWIVHQRTALGLENTEATINVSINRASSSILEVKRASTEAAKGSAFACTEKINIAKFDSLPLETFAGPWAMKIDTQGFELEVLKGAVQSLPQIKALLVEMSLISLYEGGVGFTELYGWLEDRGYRCIGLTQGFANHSTNELLQVDGLFVR